MPLHRRVNLSGGDAAFPFVTLAESVFRETLGDLHRYYISDLSFVAIPTPEEAVRNILPHLMGRGFLPPSHLFPDHLRRRLLILGSGTTEGFEHTLRVLKHDIDRENRSRERTLEPVILMPVPTYGYFLQQAELWGIPSVPIRRRLDQGGRLCAEDVRAAVERLDREGKRVVAFYDCNPHNPLGLIRDRAETEELAAVFREVNEIYRRREVAEARVTPDNPQGNPWEGPAARLRIIDDLVYDGLEFPGESPAFSFAELDAMRGDVVLLLGLSKLGLAGLRAGLMVADQDFIREAYKLQVAGSYFPNQPAMRAIEGYYRDDEPFSVRRTNHLKSLTEAHEFRGKFMLALIDGLDSVAALSEADKSAMIRAVAECKNIEPEAALARLSRPIEKVRVATRPRAGFFHMLDFSALKGLYFRSGSAGLVGPIEDEAMLERVLTDEGFHLCFGVWTGLAKEDMLERASFAIDTDLIIAAIDRLEELLTRFECPDRDHPRSVTDD